MMVAETEALRLAVDKLVAWNRGAAELSFGPPDRDIARARLLEFVRYNQPRYNVGWFHRELCAALEWFSREVVAERSPRLLIAAPPQHGKSEIVSRRFPIWHLGRNPHHHAAIASYNQDFADRISKDSRSVREWAQEWWTGLARKADGMDRLDFWQIAGGGSYKAVGAGGGLTGNPAHVLVIDDPLKDREEADSQATRESRWAWFCEAAYTRLAPGGGILVMATRWHEDDPSGRILSQLSKIENWRTVVYPALAEVDEPYRKVGEALHPERYSAEYLGRVNRVLGARSFAALYQQRPSPASGSVFLREWLLKRFRYDPQRPPEAYTEKVLSVDATFKGTDGSDYVSIGVWARRGWTEYLRLSQVCARLSFVETRQTLRDLVKIWRPNAVLVEEKANGAALVDDLAHEIPGLIAFSPDKHGNKVTRAQAATPLFEAGQVYLPEGAPWVQDYTEQMCGFPSAAHDDMVDDTSQVFLYWQEKRLAGDDSEQVALMRALLGGR